VEDVSRETLSAAMLARRLLRKHQARYHGSAWAVYGGHIRTYPCLASSAPE
jgi:hypothetical protein